MKKVIQSLELMEALAQTPRHAGEWVSTNDKAGETVRVQWHDGHFFYQFGGVNVSRLDVDRILTAGLER